MGEELIIEGGEEEIEEPEEGEEEDGPIEVIEEEDGSVVVNFEDNTTDYGTRARC